MLSRRRPQRAKLDSSSREFGFGDIHGLSKRKMHGGGVAEGERDQKEVIRPAIILSYYFRDGDRLEIIFA